MKKALLKLKNQRGASLLMSLLLLVVAIVVSAVVLAAALSAAQVKKNSEKSQQAYLTVSSAVDVFVDELSEMQFEAQQKAYYAKYGEQTNMGTDDRTGVAIYAWEETGYQKVGGDASSGAISSPATVPTASKAAVECPAGIIKKKDTNTGDISDKYIYAKLIKAAIADVRAVENKTFSNTFTVSVGYNGKKENTGAGTYNVKVDEEDQLDPVTVTFTMDPKYNFTAVFKIESSGAYTMTVTGKAPENVASFKSDLGTLADDLDDVSDTIESENYKSGDDDEVSWLNDPLEHYMYDSDDSEGEASYGPDTDDEDYYYVLDRHMTLTWTLSVEKGDATE